MELSRRTLTVYSLIAAVWALIVVWQGEEHYRFRTSAKTDLGKRSRLIANTVSACIRGMKFRGGVSTDRLQPVLDELVTGPTNALVNSGELTGIALLNLEGGKIIASGRTIDLTQKDILQRGEHWGQRNVTFVHAVDLGGSLTSEQNTNPTVVLPARPRPVVSPAIEPSRSQTNEAGVVPPPPGPRPEERPRQAPGRSRRPPWLRDLSESDYQSLVQKNTLHDLVLAMSIESFQASSARDLWLRGVILFLATISALGSAIAWRNLVTSSDLQIRLIRASELNTHLKEMNLAAAGLAHETRNPLNIIRGLAHIISRQPEAAPEIQQKSREIINEADKVAAQLNEFINYSRPREVRRSVLGINSLINEVVRALGYDLEEKNIRLEVQGDPLTIEADEQMLRQALFNLLLNAIQAVDRGGEIRVVVQRQNASEASLDVRDNGPGVPSDRRTEIFKPYFTMQKTGTGLGLAVVQQIVLAHGWEIECLANEPKGAIFRTSHLKIKS
jgi:signal transduction histidine kinase